ncbi:MAG: sigma-54-dependent Fis family transcriptional regulator [Rhodocyclaceae bacterium]|nr:sigma-54-dependent Fis family transcriptional regulator [Rhodocyclaceae bacterium]
MNLQSRSLSELLSFLDELGEPRIVMDADYRIVGANRAYAREFGHGQSVVGRRCYEVSHGFTVPCDQAGESCPLRMSLDSGQPGRVLHLHHTPRGEEHVDVETTPIRAADGSLGHFVETLRTVRHASSRPATEGLVGRAAAFNAMLALVTRVAPTGAAVLLLGETGTGKELVARLIHETSGRAEGPFVVVDCSGLTETLFESELFGYEKGAFTGATHRKTGLVEAASGGTLFLDEVGDIPMALQVKLLRLLETGTYRRVGGVDTLGSDFRLVCATHRDMGRMVDAETFRRDLYHRIGVFPVHIPALSERREDIPLLADSLLRRVSGPRRRRLSEGALHHLAARAWPGNIRELRNLLERASILADGEEIQVSHLAPPVPGWPATAHSTADRPLAIPATADEVFQVAGAEPLDDLERRYLRWLDGRFAGDRDALARALGIGRRTLFRKLRAAGLVGSRPGA